MKKLGIVFNDPSKFRNKDFYEYIVNNYNGCYYPSNKYLYVNDKSHLNRQFLFFHELGHGLDWCVNDLPIPGPGQLRSNKDIIIKELVANAFSIRLARVPSLARWSQANYAGRYGFASSKEILEAARRYKNIVKFWENA